MTSVLSGTLRRMHNVQRYSSIPVVRTENVAEHSWQITMICYLIGHDLQAHGITVMMESLLSKALTHDVSEALSGDIIRSYKHSSEQMIIACHAADRLNMLDLCCELDGEGTDSLMQDWINAKDSSLEGHIVKLADLLCVVSYCMEEHALGNSKIDFVLRELYTTTLSGYHTHTYLAPYVDPLFPNREWRDPYELTKES